MALHSRGRVDNKDWRLSFLPLDLLRFSFSIISDYQFYFTWNKVTNIIVILKVYLETRFDCARGCLLPNSCKCNYSYANLKKTVIRNTFLKVSSSSGLMV